MTDWSQYVAYKCRHRSCYEDCINPVDSSAARAKECWQCYRERDGDLPRVLSDHLPDDVDPLPA